MKRARGISRSSSSASSNKGEEEERPTEVQRGRFISVEGNDVALRRYMLSRIHAELEKTGLDPDDPRSRWEKYTLSRPGCESVTAHPHAVAAQEAAQLWRLSPLVRRHLVWGTNVIGECWSAWPISKLWPFPFEEGEANLNFLTNLKLGLPQPDVTLVFKREFLRDIKVTAHSRGSSHCTSIQRLTKYNGHVEPDRHGWRWEVYSELPRERAVDLAVRLARELAFGRWNEWCDCSSSSDSTQWQGPSEK